MNRLKDVKNVADLKELLFLNKESIKKAALPVTVVAALLLFWIGGGSSSGEEIDKVEASALDDSNYEIVVESSDIYVDIAGCVINPGVYKVKSGTRLFEVIEKAGGLSENADTISINRAEEVSDGQKIIINSKETLQDSSGIYISDGTTNGKININKADATKLQEIPGVGPSTAQKIIEYRTKTGRFNSIEDIMNVSGIGQKTFENMKDYITV